MLLSSKPPVHLTYCLNIHPGETWAENFSAIRQHTLAVRRKVAPNKPFGLGLRLSHQAAKALSRTAARQAFRRFLDDHRLYVFTINGFPYGAFHKTRVKTDVYKPDWRSVRRRNYTMRLADILASLVPDGLDGSISTVPCSYKAWITSQADMRRMVKNLMDVVIHLDAIRRRTGKEIHLGLEPEPDCYLETTADVIAFFEGPVKKWGLPYLSGRTGLTARKAGDLVARHLGVCFDACHLAVQFEPLARSLRQLVDHGIRISKIQLSAALSVTPSPAALRRLTAFADPVYLHQVKCRNRRGRTRTLSDLSVALASAACLSDPSSEWRIHFHVPLYFRGDAELGTTGTALDRAFFGTIASARISHLEIETYTFHVLPGALRSRNVAASIAREYAWVIPRLTGTRRND